MWLFKDDRIFLGPNFPSIVNKGCCIFVIIYKYSKFQKFYARAQHIFRSYYRFQ